MYLNGNISTKISLEYTIPNKFKPRTKPPITEAINIAELRSNFIILIIL